ncbi:MAG: hypothetical protein CMH28_08770 [Micavibrio sp.]|nr:hypothetical protein [Micavibrio sp.]|tara:strand:- start:850 stop:1221 length:372 start_codon:yes stop_codon:yes gene_type:complete
MLAKIKISYTKATAMAMVVILTSGVAQANNISNIAENITNSISELPTLLSALSYMFGLLLAVLGVMKIKDHVENPTQTPLKDGSIRLAAGGALFALPIVTESVLNTIGDGRAVSQAELNSLSF